MSGLWARIGRVGTIAVQIIVVLAGLATIIPFINSYVSPSNKLTADIYPMEFRLPVNLDEITMATRSTQPMNPALANLLSVGASNGFARIDLFNAGNLPIEDIHIRVSGATIYVKGTQNMNDSSVIPSDASGIRLTTLEQGSSITIYAWAGIVWGSYTNWDQLDNQFQIHFLKVSLKRDFIFR
jgi:hypothetical protein